MKKTAAFLSVALLVLSSSAEETSRVNYSNVTTSPVLDLVWMFERQSFGGVEAAVITGVKTSAGANPSGSIEVPVSLVTSDDVALIVKGIEDNAFKDQIGVTSVSIPVTVESIGTGVFTGCTVLAEIIVDDGNPWYRSAGGLLYDRDRTRLVACPARTEIVTLPASLERIGDEAFASCHRLSSLVIPESVTSIGNKAFSGCTRLKGMTFRGNAPAATASSFDGTSAELEVYRDPETSGWDTAPWTGLTLKDAAAEQPSGPESATSGRVNWTFRVIDGEAEIFGTEGEPAIPPSTVQTFSYDPENFVWIGDGALIIPSSLGGYPVTRIGEYAFAGCSALNNVVIPNGVKKIGKFAFAGCTGISSLSLPSGVREIGEHPFSGASITTLTLPDSLRELKGNPLAGCDTVLNVTLASDNSYYTVIDNVIYDKDVRKLIGCPARKESISIPSSVTEIGQEALYGCFRLRAVLLPENLATVDEGAFRDTVRLASLVFPASLRTLAGEALFDGCSALEFVGFTGDAPAVDAKLFDGTSDDLLVFVTQGTKGWDGDPASSALPAKWPQDDPYGRKIYNLDVSAEAELKEGDIFTGITTNNTISYAYTLKVLADRGVEIIGISPKPIGDFTVPSDFKSSLGTLTVKSLGDRLFANSTGLLSIEIPNAITNIGNEAFIGCNVLMEVKLNHGLRTVGRHPFEGTAIETITLPDTVSAIDGNILYGCNPSVSLSVGENNPYFAVSTEGALYDKDFAKLYAVPMLAEEVTVPATATELAPECFAGCRLLKKVTFLGDEPAVADGDGLYADSPNVTSYANEGAGFTSGTWKGRPMVIVERSNTDGTWIWTVEDGVAILYNNGKSAFVNTNHSGTVAVPAQVTDSASGSTYTVAALGDRALYGCKYVTAVTLPDTILSIGAEPFGETRIATLAIPAYVEAIDGNPAAGCARLTGFIVNGENIDFCADDAGCLYDYAKAALLAVPARAAEIEVPAAVASIADDAFAGCKVLAKVTFLGDAPSAADEILADTPMTMTTYASASATGFSGDTWKGRPLVLTGGDTPPPGELSEDVDGLVWRYRVVDGAAEIYNDGACAVESSDGSAVMDVPLPSALGGYVVKGIGDGALSNLRGITSVSVPNTYEWIGDSAFSNCTSLAEADLGSGIGEIGHWPFYGTKIRTLAIPDSVNAIDGNPVAGATLATEVTVDGGNPFFAAEDGVLYDKGKKTMLACPATKTYVELPETLEAIADDALYGSNVTFGGEYPDGDLSWSYDIRDGNAVVTGISGSSETITIPETLGGFPVTEIEPDVLASLSGVKSFESESASFSTRNGVLYSADGSMLIRVPDMMTLPHSVVSEERTDQTAIMVIPDVAIENGTPVDRTVITTNVLKSSSSCATNNVAGDVSFAELLSGVSAIGDYAFTGCNMFTNTYSKITNSASGGETGYTTSGKPYVKTIADVTVESTTYITEISLPASVHDIAPNAFASSGACVAGSSSGGTGSSTPAPSGTRLFRVTAKAISKPGYAEVYVIPSNGTDNPDETPQGIEWSNDGKEWAPAGDGVAYPVKTGKSVTIQFRSTDPRWTVPSRQNFNISESDTSVIDVTATRVSVVEAETILEPAEAKGTVSMNPKSGQVVSGKPVTLTAKPGKDTVFAYWLAGGTKVGYSATLKITPSEDATVTAVFRLKSAVEDPELDSGSIADSANAMVGVAYEASVPISDGAYPAKFSASKLPPGLKIDAANGKITGVPTKAGAYQVVVSASGGSNGKAKSSVTMPISIRALPVWAQGTFTGFAAYSDDGSGTPTRLGTSSFTVSSAGKVSGKVAVGGTNWTFTATSYDASSITDVPEDAEMRFRARTDLKAGKAAAPLVLEVRMATSPSGDGETLLNAVGDGDADLGEDGIALTAWRNIWKDKATATTAKSVLAQWEGTYTVSLEDGIDYGSGYLSLTVSGKDGNVKATGKLADGTSVSVSSPLAYDGESGTYFSYLHSAPTSYKGGSFALATGFTSPRGTLQPADPILSRWTSRNPEATGVRGDGFDRAVSFTGAYYNKLEKLNSHYEALRVSLDEGGAPELSYTYKETQKDDNGKKVTTSTAGTANAADAFAQDGMKVTVNSNGVLVVAKATKPVKDAETGTWRYDGANDGALTLSFTQATGIFKGTYTFWYDYVSAYDETRDRETLSHTSKKVNFEGIMVQGEATHYGFYLWDATGTYDDKKTGRQRTYKYRQSFPARLASE